MIILRLLMELMGRLFTNIFIRIKALDNATVRNLHHRYLSEELPFGAFPLQVLARLVGVDTPFLDSCVTLGSKFVDEPLRWNAEFLELDTQWLNSQL